MKYQLNYKPISEAQFKRRFNGAMQRYILSRSQDAFNEGKKIAVFRTDIGSLVVKP